MPYYTYLIIGGGMTADSAVGGIRRVDTRGSIGLIGLQSHPPYNRPPLSKGLWKGDPLDSIWRGNADRDVALHLGRTATALDPRNKRVLDDRGAEYTFSKLLLATGGVPRRLGAAEEPIIYFRTLKDYHSLRSLADRHQRFAVVGGGFIGSEIAAALRINGKQVVMVFPEEGIGALKFPLDLARSLTDFYRQKGIEVLPGETALGAETRGGQAVLKTRRVADGGEREIVADVIVAGIGIQPNVSLAQAAGLHVTDGIRVDRSLRTNHRDIYAAGDVANFYNPALGKRLRVEHEENANQMGELAGMAMAGRPASYDRLPYFYSDVFELGYEAVGELNSQLEMLSDWQEPYRAGVVYYLRDGRVCGVLLWNVPGRVDAARRLIAEPGPHGAAELKGRL